MNFTEIVNRYPKSFAKARVHAGILADLDAHYDITEKVTKIENGKIVEWWEEPISAEYYANCIASIGCFKDRVEIGATQAGYIATKLSNKSPYSNDRYIREYQFIYRG